MGNIIVKNEQGNKRFVLEYNRSAIVRMEREGFNINKIDSEPLTTITLLMRGAFYMHHPTLTDEEIDAICDDLQIGGAEFIKALISIYTPAILAISGQSKQETKNFKWEKN